MVMAYFRRAEMPHVVRYGGVVAHLCILLYMYGGDDRPKYNTEREYGLP
jgi:hypothetical protein